MFLGQAKAPPHLAFEHQRNEIAFLLLGAEVAQHQHLHQIPNDAALVLQIIVQPQAFVREMVADHRHRQVGAVPPAKFRRNGIAVMSRPVGNAAHLRKQSPPVSTREAVIVPIGPRMFAAVVEETDIVVAVLNRLDLAFDEIVEHGEIISDVSRDFEQHF
jgi:hypothetical protein